MSFDEAPTAAWKAFLEEEPPDLTSPKPSAPSAQQKMGRTVRSMRSRRDIRAESGDLGHRRRPLVISGVAAAVVAVLAISGYGVMSWMASHPSATVASDALPGTGARDILHASGAEYTASTLADQAKALMRTASPVGGKTAGGKTPSTSSSSSLPLKPGTIADPEQLSQCLRALGENDRQPLAVDLARYQGREAAVVVLPGATGGFDVWVVARDCRPGAEGTLAYKSIGH
jgi:hypothetical protein